MSFFDSYPAPPPPKPHRPSAQPEWYAPPRGVIPAYSQQRAILASTELVILTVGRFACYPQGVLFTLSAWFDPRNNEFDGPPWELHFPRHADPSADEFLRLGVLLADGSRWANYDWSPHSEERPRSLVVNGGGGGGGDGQWEMDQWMWPLPPEGPVSFFAAWPAYGVAETSAEVDGTELRARAGEAKVVWPS